VKACTITNTFKAFGFQDRCDKCAEVAANASCNQ
jgi:hypothetical protein